MNCERIALLLDAYADGELDAASTMQVDAHVSACPGCAAALESNRQLSAAVRSAGPYYAAPAKLHARVRKQSHPRRALVWTLVPASALVIFALAFAGIRWVQPSANQLIAQEVLDSHLRALLASHLTDVASTDQHTVKPWFAGKLDYSPPVRDFASQGFPLSGGRLDFIAGRPVAALVYQHRLHKVDLFVWPTEGGNGRPASLTERGYNIVRWSRNSMQFWAISDLNLAELTQFSKLLRE